MASLLPNGKQQYTDSAGAPLVGGLLYTYLAGTSTPQATYQDAAGTVPNTNPIVLDGRGEATVFWTGTYKAVLKSALGATIWTVDGFSDPGTLYTSILSQLAASSGSSLVGFLQAGAGAVARTAQDKMRERVSVFDFMTAAQISDVVAGTLVQDCTAPIQAAIDAAIGTVYMPPGAYKVSSTLSWTKSALTLEGAGEAGTTISFTHATQDIISIGDGAANPNDCFVRKLTITSTVVKSAGAAIKVQNGHSVGIDHIRLDNNMYTGVQFEGGAQQFLYSLSNFEINSGNTGILVGNGGLLVQDLWVRDGIISGATSDGVNLRHVSGYYFDAVDILGCKNGFTTFPDTGKQVVAGLCSRVICDTSTRNGFNLLTNGGLFADSTFSNCWASSNGSANFSTTTNNGVYFGPGAGTINGINFADLRATNQKGAGVKIDGGVNINFSSPQIFSNSTVGSAARDGFEVAAGVSNWSISGGGCGIGGLFGTNFQRYGISVAAGASNNYTIRGVIVTGNVTGPILDGGSGGQKSVQGNPGYVNAYRGALLLPSGSSSAVINHGLSVTPAQTDFLLQPTSDINANGIARYWVSAVSATTFTITANAAATGNQFFAWDAKSAGA
jgi:hypothetical protein